VRNLHFHSAPAPSNVGVAIGHNINLLNGLAQNNIGTAHKGKLNNILMHVRKYDILFVLIIPQCFEKA
jgi:hypothetical protein